MSPTLDVNACHTDACTTVYDLSPNGDLVAPAGKSKSADPLLSVNLDNVPVAVITVTFVPVLTVLPVLLLKTRIEIISLPPCKDYVGK